jgi:hypothetical protein
MWAHRGDRSAKKDGGNGDPPTHAVEIERGVRPTTPRPIRCARCDAEITDEEARISVDGAHGHCFANPAGYVFEIGCFARAPGTEVRGEPTREFSWFRGFAWSYAHCRACDAHLGWAYEGKIDGNAPRFFGLILDRLRPDED